MVQIQKLCKHDAKGGVRQEGNIQIFLGLLGTVVASEDKENLYKS